MTEENRKANGSNVYDAALGELAKLADDEEHRQGVESSVLTEARENDLWALHANLTAIEEGYRTIRDALDELEALGSDRTGDLDTALGERTEALVDELDDRASELGAAIETLQDETLDRIDGTAEVVAEEHDQTRSTLDTRAAAIQKQLADGIGRIRENLDDRFEGTRRSVDEHFAEQNERLEGHLTSLEEMIERRFDDTQAELDAAFGTTWEMLSGNFEATNERTKREVHELHHDLIQVLDERFDKIDQRFASLRADLEVIKTLQVELIEGDNSRSELLGKLGS